MGVGWQRQCGVKTRWSVDSRDGKRRCGPSPMTMSPSSVSIRLKHIFRVVQSIWIFGILPLVTRVGVLRAVFR